LDACCLNRLTDDQSQLRVREEAEAIEHILGMVRQGRATWVSSTILDLEISRNPDQERRNDVNSLLVLASEVVRPKTENADRAAELQKLGISSFDALHLACAERGEVDVFLTTDDGLLSRARRHGTALRVRAENPLSWYQELEK
jgi:predicted nucleic acid-binding protein